jgi:hypothetical protein
VWGTNDQPPSTSDGDSYFVPQFAPDEPGSRGASDYSFTLNNKKYEWDYPNSYISDNPSTCTTAERTTTQQYDKAQSKLCKYRNHPTIDLSSGRGPNYMCDAKALTRLTSNQTTVTGAINEMSAGGNTNLLEGFMWGWRTISPNVPFADGRTYGDAENKKIIVLMTDGVNAWNSQNNHNGSVYSPFGYYRNKRLSTTAPTQAQQARAQIDAAVLDACEKAKAKPHDIQVYTVGFSTPQDPIDQGGMAILKQCATSPQMAYVAKDADTIIDVFNEIARNIGGLRLAQ